MRTTGTPSAKLGRQKTSARPRSASRISSCPSAPTHSTRSPRPEPRGLRVQVLARRPVADDGQRHVAPAARRARGRASTQQREALAADEATDGEDPHRSAPPVARRAGAGRSPAAKPLRVDPAAHERELRPVLLLEEQHHLAAGEVADAGHERRRARLLGEAVARHVVELGRAVHREAPRARPLARLASEERRQQRDVAGDVGEVRVHVRRAAAAAAGPTGARPRRSRSPARARRARPPGRDGGPRASVVL